MGAIEPGVPAEYQLFGAFVEAFEEATVEIEGNGALVPAGMCCSPPFDELSPGQLPVPDCTVVDEAVLGIRRDLDVVVDRIPQDELGLRTVGSEDDVLQAPLDTPI